MAVDVDAPALVDGSDDEQEVVIQEDELAGVLGSPEGQVEGEVPVGVVVDVPAPVDDSDDDQEVVVKRMNTGEY